jgi:phage tail-like protein
MAVFREQPYAGFNFLVAIDGADPAAVAAGFARVSGLGQEVAVLAYRAGNDKQLTPRLTTGLPLPPRVVLERGVIGDLTLWTWLREALEGAPSRRTVLVQLLAEDRSGPVQAWTLRNALPVKLEGPCLDAQASAVAIERLELAAEGIECA